MSESIRAIDFNQLFDGSQFGVIARETILDSKGSIIDFRIIYINHYFYRHFAKTKTTGIGKTLTELIKDENERYNAFYQMSRAILSGESQIDEFYSSKLDMYVKVHTFSPHKDIVVSFYEDISHRFNIQRESRGKSDQLTDNVDEVFWVRRGEKVLYVNPAFERIVGLPCSLFYKDIYAILTVVHTDDYQRVNNVLAMDGIHLNASFNIEFRINNKGSIRWLWLRTFAMNDSPDGSLKKVASIIDITERKLLEEELSKNIRVMSTLFELFKKSSEHIELEDILRTAQSVINEQLNVDSLAVFMFDKASNSLILKSSFNLQEDLRNHIKKIPIGYGATSEAYLSRKRVIQITAEYKNELYREFSKGFKIHAVACFPIIYGDRVLGVLDLFIKYKASIKPSEEELITAVCNQLAVLMNNALLYKELKDELEKRKTAEQEIELLFNTAIDLMAIIRTDGTFKRISPNWCKSLGWSEAELMENNIITLIHPQDVDKTKKQGAFLFDIDHDTIIGVDNRILCKDGSYKWMAWNARLVQENDTDLIIVSGRDVTKDKEIEQKNQELEKAMQLEAVKMEFFANISHEFRTPLNIIISALQLMQQSLKDSPPNPLHDKATRHMKSIKQNSFRLLRLVNNLIDITKLDTGYFKLYPHNLDIVNVIENITQSVAQYIEGKGLNLIFDTDVEEKLIACDTEMIERIMLNLLSNAVKFTEKGGFIKVTIKDKGECIRISVRDTGIGVSQDKLDIIFERFVQEDKQLTRRCEGSGIGLSLVKSLVELHGGTIWAISNAGKGSEFIFELPVRIIDEHEEGYRSFVPTHEERIHKINIEFSDIYSLNS